MSNPSFLIFEDRQAIAFDRIVSIREINDSDLDGNGVYPRTIPVGAQTRIDTAHGYFWTTAPFDEVIERLHMIAHPLTGDSRE